MLAVPAADGGVGAPVARVEEEAEGGADAGLGLRCARRYGGLTVRLHLIGGWVLD